MILSRSREANRRQTQILRSLCFGCFVFKEVSHKWQSLANGRDGGCHLFHSFSWPLMPFTRGCLPLGQQYPPLNRKQDPCFRFLISPELVDVWPPLAKNVRGRWERDCQKWRAIESHCWHRTAWWKCVFRVSWTLNINDWNANCLFAINAQCLSVFFSIFRN